MFFEEGETPSMRLEEGGGLFLCVLKRRNKLLSYALKREVIFFILDAFAKSQNSCHSREGGSPDLSDITGFPPSRE